VEVTEGAEKIVEFRDNAFTAEGTEGAEKISIESIQDA
jgi:hypothetical protein